MLDGCRNALSDMQQPRACSLLALSHASSHGVCQCFSSHGVCQCFCCCFGVGAPGACLQSRDLRALLQPRTGTLCAGDDTPLSLVTFT